MKKTIVYTTVLVILFLVSGYADASNVKGRDVAYSHNGVMMKGYLAYDETIKGKMPGVLVVHEFWGLNDYARKRARMLAELGYMALAVDMYEDGKQAAHPEEARAFADELRKNFDTAKARFLAAMSFLKSQPGADSERIAAIGYCFGGGIVLNMARQGVDLKGVASFHGNLTAVKPAIPGSVKAKVLVLHGADDKFITVQQMEAFKKEMIDAGANFLFISYPGALHSFTNPDADEYAKTFNMKIGYNKYADTASWDKLKSFLREIFGK